MTLARMLTNFTKIEVVNMQNMRNGSLEMTIKFMVNLVVIEIMLEINKETHVICHYIPPFGTWPSNNRIFNQPIHTFKSQTFVCEEALK
jgi:hypothetical protein